MDPVEDSDSTPTHDIPPVCSKHPNFNDLLGSALKESDDTLVIDLTAEKNTKKSAEENTEKFDEFEDCLRKETDKTPEELIRWNVTQKKTPTNRKNIDPKDTKCCLEPSEMTKTTERE
uniref:RPAP1_N domain-containing protein n=1 Tax=Caenorhabditis tropicalis TaxID=1561998 RepID=A0A1I7U836_9PELO